MTGGPGSKQDINFREHGTTRHIKKSVPIINKSTNMKSIQMNTLKRNVITGILATAMVLAFGACARKTASLSESMLPESNGQVQIKRDANSNYVIHINLSDLENEKSLQPAKDGYVVWMVSNQRKTKNIGQIEGANTWLSKKSKASFEAVSAIKPTKIYITAENDMNIQKPGTQVVWSTKSF